MKYKILVCEDDEFQNKIYEAILSHEAHLDVTYVKSGKCAMALAFESSFDLIVLDMGLPDFSGTEVLHFLQKTEKKNTEVIIVSGYVDDDFMTKIDQTYRVRGYLKKPFNRGSLLGLLPPPIQL
jgi:DNA-binding response OmpR family regulator